MASPASMTYLQTVYPLVKGNYQQMTTGLDGPVLQQMHINPEQTPLAHGHDYSAVYLSPLSKPQVGIVDSCQLLSPVLMPNDCQLSSRMCG